MTLRMWLNNLSYLSPSIVPLSHSPHPSLLSPHASETTCSSNNDNNNHHPKHYHLQYLQLHPSPNNNNPPLMRSAALSPLGNWPNWFPFWSSNTTLQHFLFPLPCFHFFPQHHHFHHPSPYCRLAPVAPTFTSCSTMSAPTAALCSHHATTVSARCTTAARGSQGCNFSMPILETHEWNWKGKKVAVLEEHRTVVEVPSGIVWVGTERQACCSCWCWGSKQVEKNEVVAMGVTV